jgi:hypothetical protein
MHIDDLKTALVQLGFNYQLAGGASWQEICPACKRKMLARVQWHRKKVANG